jgi:hypothetical protein
MANPYAEKLLQQLAGYKQRALPGVPDGTSKHSGEVRPYAHILPDESYQSNILPGIRDAFWRWFESQAPALTLQPLFHHLDSSQAMAFNLFFPFLRDGGVDERLLDVLGISAEAGYEGRFEKVLDPAENTRFDFYLEGPSGLKIFFDVKLCEDGFGSCDDDEHHRQKLERHYRPHLHEHVDAKWLEPEAFFANYRVLRNLSYLGRHPDSGLVFIFPKASEPLMEAENSIKMIVSKSLAPRIAILYLEYLVERILEAVADDEALRKHFLEFRDKYVCI